MRTVLACLLALCCAPALAALQVGDLPPQHVGTDVADKAVSLDAFEGKVVVVTSKAYDVQRIPHMFMLDKGGRIARIHVGYDEKALDTILKEINELLAQ